MSPIPNKSSFPFSRPLEVATVGEDGLSLSIAAKEVELRALAAMDGLVDIASLEADLVIRREGRSGLHVTGEIRTRVRQTCVVTLEDFDADLTEPVDVRFAPQGDIEADAARRARMAPPGAEAPEDDLPDPIVNGRIDLGALAAEFLALGLDPYPRKPGTAFAEPAHPQDDGKTGSPFAILGQLKSH